MVTFTIVEKSDDFDYDSFEKDYMSESYSKQELMDKYGLSNAQYHSKVKWVKHFSNYEEKQDDSMKYIYYNKDKFVIQHQGVYCGRYTDLETAQIVRDILVEYDWKEEMIRECMKLYSASNLKLRGSKSYNDAPLKKEALKRFDEFRELFESNKHTGRQIQKIMGFTHHQYRVCRNKMKAIDNSRKQLVREHDRVM